MTTHSTFRSPALLSLLVAALLYVAGASAGPWMHLQEHGAADVAQASEQAAPDDPQVPADHDDCELCEAFSASAAPTVAPDARIGVWTSAPSPASVEYANPHTPGAPPQARDPPFA